MAYATTSDVQARIPGFTLSVSTKPTLAQVTQWLVEADAMLNGALLAAELTSPNVDARGVEILKSWACDYAEAHVRMARAGGSSGDGSNDDGESMLAAFRKLVSADPGDNGIMFNGPLYGRMLESGNSPAPAAIRGHVLDNNDGLTVENGDYAPAFTASAGGDQF